MDNKREALIVLACLVAVDVLAWALLGWKLGASMLVAVVLWALAVLII